MTDADEDAELAAALAMSRGDEASTTSPSAAAEEDVDMASDEIDEEEDVRRAIALSLQGEQQEDSKRKQ